jgi:hypothetical protein
MTFVDELGKRQVKTPVGEEGPSDQWFFQFQENLLLTVQSIHRLREAMASRMP